MSKKREDKPRAQRLRCPNCGAPRDPRDRFCRQCGASLAGGTTKKNGPLRGLTGLRAFGIAVIAVAAVYALIYYGGRGSRESTVPSQRIGIGEVGAPAIGGAPAATPLQAADQLFNDAMIAYETGDSITARQYIPMALMAYQRLDTLSLDSRYHMALLSLAAGRPEDALAQADTMMAQVPDHLLALTSAARAYEVTGRTGQAIELFRRFLDAYTPDVAASRSEYIDHGRALPGQREEAEEFLRKHGVRTEGS